MECILFRVKTIEDGIQTPMMRYDLLCRAAKVMQRCGISLLAFGVNPRQVRFVVEGNMNQVPNLIRGIKVGTLRAARARGKSPGRGAARQARGRSTR